MRKARWRVLLRPRFWIVVTVLGLVLFGLFKTFPHFEAWYHFRAARTELTRYHNAQAIRHLQVCLRVWPEDSDVQLLAARAARRARRYREAERLLEKYQQTRHLDDAGASEQLLLSAERRVDQVLDVCWRHVEQGHPDSTLILEALTGGYLRQYRLAEAHMCLERWMQSAPENPQAYYLEGVYYLDYGHARSAAEKSFRRAVELDPEHEEARQALAVCLIEAKEFTEAIEHFQYVARRQPDNVSVQVGLAECREALGELPEAVRLLDAVLDRQPEFGPALSLRGRLALESGESEKAEMWLREALALNPSDHRALYNLTMCLHQNGKQQEAQQLKEQLQRMEENLARFNEIVTKEMLQRPRDPALHCELGELLLSGGQREEGVRWLQSALRVDPHYEPARRALASARESLGQVAPKSGGTP